MSQQSEERAPESTPASDAPQSARILHMKSTHYDLQRAIQQRAQESVEREAQLDREERRPKPLKWLVIFVIACVPIALTLFLVDGFLRAFHKYLDTTTQQQEQQAQPTEEYPDETNLQSQPGVVLLQPLNPQEAAAPEQDAAKGATSDPAATPPESN